MSPRILLVEDDEFVRSVVTAQLSTLGYRVLTAADAGEALAALERGEPADLLMTDVLMPGPMDGYALAAQVRRRRPELPVLYASGSAVERDDAGTPAAPSLQKPYGLRELDAKVREALAAARPVGTTLGG